MSVVSSRRRFVIKRHSSSGYGAWAGVALSRERACVTHAVWARERVGRRADRRRRRPSPRSCSKNDGPSPINGAIDTTSKPQNNACAMRKWKRARQGQPRAPGPALDGLRGARSTCRARRTPGTRHPGRPRSRGPHVASALHDPVPGPRAPTVRPTPPESSREAVKPFLIQFCMAPRSPLPTCTISTHKTRARE